MWASVGLVLALAACNGENGFIQIRTVPTSAVAQLPLYLDSEKLEPLKKGEAVVTRRIGTAKLQTDAAGGHLAVLCEIAVKKNRITTVTISVAERPPRCQCRTSADQASRSIRMCIS
jgi:hypothetical protein